MEFGNDNLVVGQDFMWFTGECCRRLANLPGPLAVGTCRGGSLPMAPFFLFHWDTWLQPPASQRPWPRDFGTFPAQMVRGSFEARRWPDSSGVEWCAHNDDSYDRLPAALPVAARNFRSL
jgi:hypothetical protein